MRRELIENKGKIVGFKDNEKGVEYRIGDKVVYNHIVSFCNEFNGEISKFRRLKGGGVNVTIENRRSYMKREFNCTTGNWDEIGMEEMVENVTCGTYCLIRKGNDGSGVDHDYN